jgi:hypothetical protein
MTEGFKTGGRQKGTPNKMTKALKDMILGALEAKGGQEYLELQADKNPVAFLNLVGKVLPTTLQGDPDNPVHLNITEEQRRREVDAAIDAAFREYPREEEAAPEPPPSVPPTTTITFPPATPLSRPVAQPRHRHSPRYGGGWGS